MLTRIVALVSLALVLAANGLGFQGVYGEWVVQPHEHASRDGHWKLAVDPTQRQGAGPADYELTHDGQLAWKGRLPFTLLDAAVTSDGTFVGYAYTEGVESSKGECVLATIGADGKERGRLAEPRHGPAGPHGQPEPNVRGVAIADDQGWWLARHYDGTRDDVEHVLVRIDLATGARIDAVPLELFRDFEGRNYEVLKSVEPLAGFPLLALHWRTSRPASGDGAHFELIELPGNSVWSLELPGDYGVDDDEADERFERATLAVALRRGVEPGRFSIVAAKPEERVELQVSRVDERWSVLELGRSPVELPRLRGRFVRDPVASASLVRIAQVELAAPRVADDALRAISAFGFDREDRIMLAGVVGDARRPECRVLTTDGALLARAPVPLPAGLGEGKTHYFPFPDGRWLVVHALFGPRAPSKAWWFDPKTCELAPLEQWSESGDIDVAPLAKGGFVALLDISERYTSRHSLIRCYPDGKALWRFDDDAGYGGTDIELLSPDSVCVTSSGEVVVVDPVRESLQIFQDDGNFVRLVSLEDVYGESLRYTSEIEAHPNGGVVIGAAGDIAVLHCDLEGKQIAALPPARVPDGPSRLSSDVEVAPDGSIWCRAGARLARLDARGTVERVLGESEKANELHSVSDAWIDRRGRVILLDYATKCWHVFDAEGKRTAIAALPRREPPIARASDEALVAGPGGEFWTRVAQGWQRFDADGRALDIVAERARQEVPLADGRAWTYGLELGLLDPAGGVLAKHERLPDRRWFRYARIPAPQAVRADEVALVQENVVCIYGSNGEPVESHELPRGWGGDIALSGRWIACPGAGPSVLLWSRATRVAFEFVPPDIGAKSSMVLGFSPDERELWVVDLETRNLLRYALPER
ncbi:MAG: hypothetical protein IT453_00845 [Planctomycetes bacterium]|nr:hypothetical protein [Planctomycetota bacterium]